MSLSVRACKNVYVQKYSYVCTSVDEHFVLRALSPVYKVRPCLSFEFIGNRQPTF